MKFKITIVAVLIASAAYAQKGDKPKGDMCKDWGDMAVGVMRERQSGKPLHELMEKANNTVAIRNLVKDIIIRAYERPIFPDEKGKASAIADYRNDTELRCYKATK